MHGKQWLAGDQGGLLRKVLTAGGLEWRKDA